MKFDNETKIEVGKHKRTSILTCLPTFGKLDIAFYVATQRLMTPVNALIESYVIVGKEIGEARNDFAKYCLSLPKEKRPEFLFFIGDDMIPRCDALIKLWEIMKKETWDVLAALYYIKQDIVPTPILWREEIDGVLEAGIHYQLGETVESDICGLDFTLIRPEIFERIDYPYFKTGPTFTETGTWLHTEDAWFVKKVKQVGGRVGVATSVIVGHLDVNTGEVY